MLAGRKDALALLGVASGFAATNPLLAASSVTIPLLAAAAAGTGYLAYSKGKNLINFTDSESREGFVLPSDDVFTTCLGKGGIRFGQTKDRNLPLDISNEFLMRHTAIVGQSGVGKTALGQYILWQQMVRGGGWIFIDAKLEKQTLNKLAYMAKCAGREEDFFVLNINEPENSHTYNPILHGDADEVASRLLNLIPSTENDAGADHYRQAANQALTVIISALKASQFRYHFGDLAILLQSGRALEYLLKLIKRDTPEYRQLSLYVDQFVMGQGGHGQSRKINTRKMQDLLGGIAGRIANFAQGKFGEVFNTYTPELDLSDIILNNKFLYVALPTMGKDTAALNVGKLLLSDLRSAVADIQELDEAEKPDPPFVIFADEMGSYVTPGIARLFEQARSANIALIPAFQSFANLSSVCRNFDDMLIQNTWNKVFFKFGSKDSSELAAEIIGKTMGYLHSVNISESESKSAFSLRTTPHSSESDSGSRAESWNQRESFRVSPDQLKSLPIGEAILMSGARMFHIDTPLLNFSELEEYSPVRYPVTLPKFERTINLQDRYKEFISF